MLRTQSRDLRRYFRLDRPGNLFAAKNSGRHRNCEILQELARDCQFCRAENEISKQIPDNSNVFSKTKLLIPMTTILHKSNRSVAAIIFTLMLTGAAIAADFDRDGKADFAVFRPSSTAWLCAPSAGKTASTEFQWGHSTDVLVPADYDGDGRTDIAVWRPENGVWYIHQSGDAQVLLVKWGTTTMHPTGGLPDVPVPADFDGDGRTDLGVWRPDSGEWWILKSSNDYDQDQPLVYRWGKLGDIPVQADYDGDGLTDLAVFRSMENRWYIHESASGKMSAHAFGIAGMDVLVPADYTGDRKADVAVYRGGIWYVLSSETSETETFHLGFTDDTPVPADFDGDGLTDFAVYRSGTWYVYDSSSPRLRSFNFGQLGDVPVNSGTVRQSIVAIP
jgi:hypothetical protein